MWARDDGERLLYGSNASGKWELYAWDRRANSHRQVTDRPEGTTAGRLDPSGATIWWFDDRKGDEMGGWMVEPFDGSERPKLAAPDLPPAYRAGLALGRHFAVIGRSGEGQSSVHRLDADGATTQLYRHREDSSVAGLSHDERLVALSHSEHGDSRHPALRAIDLEGSTVAELWDGPGQGLHALGWAPAESDSRLLVRHERGEMPRLLIWDVEQSAVQELDIDLPGELRASWYPDADALLLVHDHRGRGELYRYDLATTQLDPIETPPGSISDARVRPREEREEGTASPPLVWYSVSSSSEPPRIRATDGTTVLTPPGEPAPEGASYTHHYADDVPFFLAEPPGGLRPHPTVFQVHGGPHAHDRDEFFPRIQSWVDHGFAVVMVNYRGSTGYGKPWRDALEGNPGLTELADVGRVLSQVVDDGIVDPQKVVLAGNSWGGYICLLGLGLQPERWTLGLAGVPVADYVAAYEDEMEPLKAFDRALFGGSPDDVPEHYRERSPIEFVEKVRVPVLILAGGNDPRCPIRQIDNYLSRLSELGKPHEVYRFDAGHGSLVVDEAIRQQERQIAFVAEHLGTPRPA